MKLHLYLGIKVRGKEIRKERGSGGVKESGRGRETDKREDETKGCRGVSVTSNEK